METVTMSLEKYESMKQEIESLKHVISDIKEQMKSEKTLFDATFGIEESESNGEIHLTFNAGACRELLKERLFIEGYDETHEIKAGWLDVKDEDYTDIPHYVVYAKRKELQEIEEDE